MLIERLKNRTLRTINPIANIAAVTELATMAKSTYLPTAELLDMTGDAAQLSAAANSNYRLAPLFATANLLLLLIYFCLLS